MPLKEKGPNSRGSNQYMKYAGLAFQFFALFGLAFYIGQQIDKYFGNNKPFIAMLLILVSFIAIIYKIAKDLSS